MAEQSNAGQGQGRAGAGDAPCSRFFFSGLGFLSCIAGVRGALCSAGTPFKKSENASGAPPGSIGPRTTCVLWISEGCGQAGCQEAQARKKARSGCVSCPSPGLGNPGAGHVSPRAVHSAQGRGSGSTLPSIALLRHDHAWSLPCPAPAFPRPVQTSPALPSTHIAQICMWGGARCPLLPPVCSALPAQGR